MPIDSVEVARESGQGRHSTPRLMFYLLLSVVLMAMDQSGRFVPKIRATLSYAIEPIHYLAELPVRTLRGVRTYTRSYGSLEEENRVQDEQLLEQAAQVQRLGALEEENRRLRALLDATQGRQYGFRFAEMLMVSLDPYAHIVVIDRGLNDGVFEGQAVIDGDGVMGQVESVQLGQARVRLISDPDHAIPVQILRTGQRTVAYGTGSAGTLSLPDLPMQSDVREGDMLITSGLGDRFPAGFPVAEVFVVERTQGEAFAHIEARPLAALDRGREVLLVVRQADIKLEDLPEAQTTEPEPDEEVPE